MSEPSVFPCERCGACCRTITPGFARVAGVPLSEDGKRCAHQQADGLCEIFSTRPALCRVEAMFLLAQERLGMGWSEFVVKNRSACRELRMREALA